MSMEEMKKDSEEFAKLISLSTRARIRNTLTVAKAELDKEMANLEFKERQAAGKKPTDVAPKRYLVELTEYAWDQSEKFVKFFITLDGVQSLDEASVSVHFDKNTMSLLVTNMNGKDYGLTISNLVHDIDTEKSYRKIKTDMIAIYLKKKDEGKHWDHLTTIAKRLKEKQDQDLKSENPEDALVSIMKKMYQSGDSQTKQMIAKAWTESQNK